MLQPWLGCLSAGPECIPPVLCACPQYTRLLHGATPLVSGGLTQPTHHMLVIGMLHTGMEVDLQATEPVAIAFTAYSTHQATQT